MWIRMESLIVPNDHRLSPCSFLCLEESTSPQSVFFMDTMHGEALVFFSSFISPFNGGGEEQKPAVPLPFLSFLLSFRLCISLSIFLVFFLNTRERKEGEGEGASEVSE